MKPSDVLWNNITQDIFAAVLIDSDGRLFLLHKTYNENNNFRCLFRYRSELEIKEISAFEMRCLIETAVGNKTLRNWVDDK